MALIEHLAMPLPPYVDRAIGRVVIKELKAQDPVVFGSAELSDDAETLVGPLPFYKRYVLVELPVCRGRGPEFVFALHIPKSARLEEDKAPATIWLNGNSKSIHCANTAEALDLAEEHARDYLRFFVNFLRSREEHDEPFTLLDTMDLIESVESDMTPTEQMEFVATGERFMSNTIGLAGVTRKTATEYEARFPIALGAKFADLAKFNITTDGEVSMKISTGDLEGQLRPVAALKVRTIPAFRRISLEVLQARRDMLAVGSEDPEALGRRLAEANKLGEAGRERPNDGDDEARQYYDEAIELLHEILFDYVHILGPDHRDTIIARTSLEYWKIIRSWSKGYGEEALHDVRSLVATQMRSLGSFHQRTLNTRRNIALMLASQTERSSGGPNDAVDSRDGTGHTKAIAELRWLIADIREHLSEDPLDESSQGDKLEEILVTSQLSLAQALHDMGDDLAAIEELKMLLAFPRSTVPALTMTLSNAHNLLAEWLFGAGRVDEAIVESQAHLAELRAAEIPDEFAIDEVEDQLAFFEGRVDGGRK